MTIPSKSPHIQSILRIESLTMSTKDLEATARFYRWAVQLKDAAETPRAGTRTLSWGREDRIRLVESPTGPAIGCRMPAMPLGAAAAWCAERELLPEVVAVGPDDIALARSEWPGISIQEVEDEAAWNRTVIAVQGPFGQRVELAFPTPRDRLASQRRIGPFYWKSGDWSGLEIPGILGVTTSVPDPVAFRDFARTLGLVPMEVDNEAAPLRVGDHQWVVDQSETPGISALAVVVSASRISDLKRTLEHLGAEYREEGNRLLAADPDGRVVLVSGVRGA